MVIDVILCLAMVAVYMLLGAVLPFVVSLIVQAVVCKIRRMRMRLALSWWDVLTIVLVPFLWDALKWTGGTKSLSNLIEFPIMGLAWGVCYAIRTAFMCRQVPPRAWVAALVSVCILSAVAVIMANFFPALPE